MWFPVLGVLVCVIWVCQQRDYYLSSTRKTSCQLSERPPALTLFFANQTSANDSVCRIHVVIPTLCFFRTEEVATREAMMSLTTSFLLRRCRLLLSWLTRARGAHLWLFWREKKHQVFFFTSREGLRHVAIMRTIVTDEDGYCWGWGKSGGIGQYVRGEIGAELCLCCGVWSW